MDWVTVIGDCPPDLFDRVVENITNDFEHLPGFDVGECIGRKNGGLISSQVHSPIGWYAEKLPVVICCVAQSRALIIFSGAWNKDG